MAQYFLLLGLTGAGQWKLRCDVRIGILTVKATHARACTVCVQVEQLCTCKCVNQHQKCLACCSCCEPGTMSARTPPQKACNSFQVLSSPRFMEMQSRRSSRWWQSRPKRLTALAPLTRHLMWKNHHTARALEIVKPACFLREGLATLIGDPPSEARWKKEA